MKLTRFEVIALLIACLLSLQSNCAAWSKDQVIVYGDELVLSSSDDNDIKQALLEHEQDCKRIRFVGEKISNSNWILIGKLPNFHSAAVYIHTNSDIEQLERIRECKNVNELAINIGTSAEATRSKLDLSKIPDLPGVNKLVLAYSNNLNDDTEKKITISANEIFHTTKKDLDFSKFRNLKDLRICEHDSSRGGVDLNSLLPLSRTLESLYIGARAGKHMSGLRNFESLKQLEVSDICEGFGDCILPKSIENLEVSIETDISPIAAQLPGLKHLRRLYVVGTPLSSGSLRSICKVDSLEDLSCTFDNFQDADLTALSNLTNLQKLYARSSGTAHGSFLSAFSKRNKLKELVICFLELDYSGLKAISTLTSLEVLRVKDDRTESNCILNSVVCVEFEKLVNLRQLDGAYPKKNTDEWAKVLSHMPHLKEINLGSSDLSDKGIAYLASCEELEKLYAYSTQVSGASLDELSKLNKFKGLSLVGCTISDLGFRSIAKLSNLEILILARAKFSKSALSSLESLSNLKCLNLEGTDIGNGDCLKFVGSLPSLEVLDVSKTDTVDASLACLANSKLRQLYISNTEVTEKGLDSLRKLKSLKYVKAKECGILGAKIYPWKFDDLCCANIPAREEDIVSRDGESEVRHELEKSLSDIKRRVKEDPGNENLKEKLEVYEAQLSGNIDRPLGSVNIQIREHPDNASYYEKRALLLLRFGRYKESLPDFEKAIASRKKIWLPISEYVIDGWGRDMFPLYVDRAFVYNALKQYDLALADAEVAIKMRRLSVPARLRRAYANVMLGSADKAVDDLNRCLELEPDCAAAYAYRAMAYQKLGKKDLAEKDEAKAKELGFEKAYPD